jgi:hypothetical protein
MASVFGVNLVSRPGISLYGSIGIPGCSVDAECNAVKNNCVTEFCHLVNIPNSLGGNTNYCDISFYDTSAGGNCPNCNVCGNGRCEPGAPVPEDSATCSLDCLKSAGFTASRTEVCVTTQCGAELFVQDSDFTNSTAIPPAFDGCCPKGCQGVNSNDSLTFDPDCCTQCGDGVFDSLGGEECGEPGAPTCGTNQVCVNCRCQPDCRLNGILDSFEQCDPGATPTGCAAGDACDQQCHCQPIPPTCGNNVVDPGETCDPPNGTTCDANCQLIPQPVCGNGIVETGEECEGTTCSVTLTDGTVVPGVCQACQCTPECQVEGSGCGDNANTSIPCVVGTGGTGGSSLIPSPVHSTVLAQWIATFAVPGAAFVGLRARRKSKNK